MTWIKLIYTQQVAEIRMGGCKSDKIKIGRGVRQGPPPVTHIHTHTPVQHNDQNTHLLFVNLKKSQGSQLTP